jgi:hypothetical protein
MNHFSIHQQFSDEPHDCTTLKRANLRFSVLNPGDP